MQADASKQNIKNEFFPIEIYKPSSATVLENPVTAALAKPLRTAWNYTGVTRGYFKQMKSNRK